MHLLIISLCAFIATGTVLYMAGMGIQKSLLISAIGMIILVLIALLRGGGKPGLDRREGL